MGTRSKATTTQCVKIEKKQQQQHRKWQDDKMGLNFRTSLLLIYQLNGKELNDELKHIMGRFTSLFFKTSMCMIEEQWSCDGRERKKKRKKDSDC